MKCLVLLSLLITCLSSPGCIGIKKDNGEIKPKAVDWYVVNFIAYDSKSKKVALDYMDSTMENSGSKPTRYALLEHETPMMQTLSGVDEEFKSKQKEMVVLAWNDHPSGEKATTSYAHSKGFLAFDKTKGFLMNHSLPKFPVPGKKLFSEEFDSNFGTYMQHFYCENYERSALSTIFEALYVIKPNVYIDVPKDNFKTQRDKAIEKKPKIKSTQISTIVKTIEGVLLSSKQRKARLVKKKMAENHYKSGIMTRKQRANLSKNDQLSFIALNRGKFKPRSNSRRRQRYNTSSSKPRRSKRLAEKRFNKISIKVENEFKKPSPRIRSEKKKTITFFAKPHTKTKFLPWSKEILEEYQKDFYSLTWKAKAMEADKSIDNKVFTVEKIQMASDDSLDIDSEIKKVYKKTKHTQNHAKWAVSTKGEIVCLGDLNHDPTQLKRGGMIICFENKIVANYFGNRVKEYNK